ncbi:acyl carrier protein [Thiomicrolovo sp. ZZH C-3]
MTKEAISRAIKDAIMAVAPEVEEEEILPDAPIQRSLEIDSFDFLKILTELNDKLGVDVPEADYGMVSTLAQMTDYFDAKLS